MKKTDILNAAKSNDRRNGILTADRYFRSIESCFEGDGFCPVKLFDAHGADDWSQALEQSESTLVYSDRDCVVSDFKRPEKANGSGLLTFDAIVTTTKRDRDRDILDTKGATLDPKAPLLWQHIPLQPIGALVKELKRTDEMLPARFAIADTELGRDAAVLVEMGALRISHGFDPTEFEPLKDDGFHITKFDIVEVSLVSIPSNTDAVITAFSRGKLHHPLVKSWAGHEFDSRKKQIPSGFSYRMKCDGVEEEFTAPSREELLKSISEVDSLGETKADDEPESKQQLECPECGHKGAMSQFMSDDEKSAEPDTEKMYCPLPGSWGAIENDLRQSVNAYLNDNGVPLGEDEGGWIEGIFSDHAIVTVWRSGDGDEEFYRISWTTEEGKPVWTGDPVPVELDMSVSITERRERRIQFTKSIGTKRGRVLSAKNEQKIKDAQASARKASETLEAVLGQLGEPEQESHETLEQKLLTAAVAGDFDTLKSVHTRLGEMLDAYEFNELVG